MDGVKHNITTTTTTTTTTLFSLLVLRLFRVVSCEEKIFEKKHSRVFIKTAEKKWRRRRAITSRAYTKSSAWIPGAFSSCNKVCSFYSSRSFSVKTDSLFLFLSHIAHDATMKNRTASEHRSTKNVHATSDGKRDGVGRVEIFRRRRERV